MYSLIHTDRNGKSEGENRPEIPVLTILHYIHTPEQQQKKRYEEYRFHVLFLPVRARVCPSFLFFFFFCMRITKTLSIQLSVYHCNCIAYPHPNAHTHGGSPHSWHVIKFNTIPSFLRMRIGILLRLIEVLLPCGYYCYCCCFDFARFGVVCCILFAMGEKMGV